MKFVHIDENGDDVFLRIPLEDEDYGLIYDNLFDVIENNAERIVKDEEVIEVLRIIEDGMEIAKEANQL